MSKSGKMIGIDGKKWGYRISEKREIYTYRDREMEKEREFSLQMCGLGCR